MPLLNKNKKQNKQKGPQKQKKQRAINLSLDDINALRKRQSKKDIVMDLDNKYKNYESEVVFKFYEKFKEEEARNAKDKELRKQRAKAKQKNREKVFSIKALTTEINGFGFSYSLKDYMILLGLVFAALIGVGVYLKLKAMAILFLMLATILMVPSVVSSQFKFIHEQQRFRDVVDYCEYMCYEFKKKPKIILALKAAHSSCTGEMKKRVKKAIDYIENGIFHENLYKEAFYFIEEGYNCEKIAMVHEFIMKVEDEGGEYQESLNIILDDIKGWTERTYVFQKDKAAIKRNIIITIALALVMCAILTNSNLKVMPEFTKNSVYQVATAVLIVAFMWLFSIVQKKLSGSWLVSAEIPKRKMFEQYALAITGDVKTIRKKSLVTTIAFAVLGVYLYISKISTAGALMLFAFSAWFYFVKPSSDVKNARKQTIKEIEKEFPGWLRNLAINLQKETVHVSIKKSLKDAPLVLKPSLVSLIKELEDDPVTIKPYVNFLSGFELPDISSAMKMLYSLNEAGQDEVVNQVNTLVTRNNALLEKSEILKQQESISLAGFLVAVPMFFSFFKMIIDMGIVMIGFLSKF